MRIIQRLMRKHSRLAGKATGEGEVKHYLEDFCVATIKNFPNQFIDKGY